MAKKKARRRVSDVVRIFRQIKRLDPGSVVREGEFATSRNSPKVPASVRLRLNKALRSRRK